MLIFCNRERETLRTEGGELGCGTPGFVAPEVLFYSSEKMLNGKDEICCTAVKVALTARFRPAHEQ